MFSESWVWEKQGLCKLDTCRIDARLLFVVVVGQSPDSVNDGAKYK